MTKKPDIRIDVTLKNVFVGSYPKIYEPNGPDAKFDINKYVCELIIPKDSEAHKTLMDAKSTMLKQLIDSTKDKKSKLESHIKDGDILNNYNNKNERKHLYGCVYLKAKQSVNDLNIAPVLVDEQKQPTVKGDIGPGSKVNAVLGLYITNYGDYTMCCSLRVLQRVGHKRIELDLAVSNPLNQLDVVDLPDEDLNRLGL